MVGVFVALFLVYKVSVQQIQSFLWPDFIEGD